MKANHFFFILIILPLLLCCAETQVDNNVRVLVEGRVVDQNNNPIENASIKVVTDAGFQGASPVTLAEGFSNASGNFEMVSLFGSNSIFYIEVSNGFDYSYYEYFTSTSEFRPDDLTFNINTAILNKLSTFNYSIVRQSTLDTTINFSFRFNNPFCREFYSDGVLDENQNSCFEERLVSRNFNEDFTGTFERSFSVSQGDTVIFTYSINGGPEQEEILTIDSEEYDFQFEY